MPIPVWILGFFAFFNDSAATSISFSLALLKAHTDAFFIILEISTTDLKSPGLEIGKPASMMSTPSRSIFSAKINLLLVSSLQPGTCSPSLKVVSKI